MEKDTRIGTGMTQPCSWEVASESLRLLPSSKTSSSGRLSKPDSSARRYIHFKNCSQSYSVLEKEKYIIHAYTLGVLPVGHQDGEALRVADGYHKRGGGQ